MKVSRFIGVGMLGIRVSDVCFMSRFNTVRLPVVHLRANLTGPDGGGPALTTGSDFLQPSSDRLNATTRTTNNGFRLMNDVFIVCIFLPS
jgi:hypothetical protein